LLFRAITTVTSLIVAAILAAISFQSVSAVAIHIQNQMPNSALLPLGTAIATFLMAVIFAAPTMRMNLLVRSYRPMGRFFFFLLCLAIAGGIALAGTAIMLSGPPKVYGVFPTTLIQPAGIALAVLFVLTFIFPGFAFRDLRKAEAEANKDPSVKRYTLNKKSAPVVGGVPFQKTAMSRLANFLLGLFFLIYLFGGVYGAREARFLPSQAHYQWVKQNPTLWLAIPIGLFAVLALLGKRAPGKGILRSSIVQKLVVFVLMAIVAAILSHPLLTKGLPDLLSFVTTGPEASQNVIVQQTGKEIRGRGCNRTATVTPAVGGGAVTTICAIPSDIWKTLRVGDRLILSGEQTPFGLHYSNIAKP